MDSKARVASPNVTEILECLLFLSPVEKEDIDLRDASTDANLCRQLRPHSLASPGVLPFLLDMGSWYVRDTWSTWGARIRLGKLYTSGQPTSTLKGSLVMFSVQWNPLKLPEFSF